jgi:hypothetical protein
MDPTLQANMFAIAGKQQATTGGPKTLTDEFLAATALGNAAADRSKIPEIARQYSEFYNKGILNQWGNGGAAVLGYPKPHGYALSTVYTTATGKAIDTGSPAAVEHWINMNLQRQAAEKAFGDNPIGFMFDQSQHLGKQPEQ